jgi:predicted RNA-binding protein (TIGR00451 family)
LQIKPVRLWVQVEDEAAKFIAEGRSVFAKHVTDCDEGIRPGEEVVILNRKTEVLAVGRSVLAGKEIMAFRQGVAVRIRRGVDEGRRGKVKKENLKTIVRGERVAQRDQSTRN